MPWSAGTPAGNKRGSSGIMRPLRPFLPPHGVGPECHARCTAETKKIKQYQLRNSFRPGSGTQVGLIFGRHFEPHHLPIRPMVIEWGRAMYNMIRLKTVTAIATL